MNIDTQDLTYRWGDEVNPEERWNGKWRHALYQDLNESFDSKMLYFLYDKTEDQTCQTTGDSKGESGLVIFDTDARYFTGTIPLHFAGTLKFLFNLKCPSPQGGSSLILITEQFNCGVNKLNVFRLNMSANGLCTAEIRGLLLQPISVADDGYICTMRQDVPEIVIMCGAGLQVFRIDCMSDVPSNPIDYFFIPNAELSHFYDGFVHKGRVVLLSSHKDGYLDWSRVHTFPLTGSIKQIVSHFCTADIANGYPSPRKECGLDTCNKGIMVAGGEFGEMHGSVTRLRDYWMLDLTNYQWKMLAGEMPCDLIEPRLTITNIGNVYLWGDYDVPIADFPLHCGTHIRIFKIFGIEEPYHYLPKEVGSAHMSEKSGDRRDAEQILLQRLTNVPEVKVPPQTTYTQAPLPGNVPSVTEVSFEDPVYRATVEQKKHGKKHHKFCCFQ